MYIYIYIYIYIYWVDIRRPGVCFPEPKRWFHVVQIVQTGPVISRAPI